MDAEIKKFWDRVDVKGPTECWPYKGKRLKAGYGTLRFRGTATTAHRAAFLIEHGHWPDPMCCHHCDNPPCCNPAHLYEGTHAENMRDKVARGRSAQLAGAKISATVRARNSHAGKHVGSKNGRAVLSDEQVARLRYEYERGWSTQAALAARFGISQPQVSRLIRGEQRAVIEE